MNKSSADWWSFFIAPYTYQIYILSAVRVQSWWAYGALMVGLPLPKPKSCTELISSLCQWLSDFV
jgi:hypothetical protein